MAGTRRACSVKCGRLLKHLFDFSTRTVETKDSGACLTGKAISSVHDVSIENDRNWLLTPIRKKSTICATVVCMLQGFQPQGSLFRDSTDGEFRITWRKPLFGRVGCSAWMISSTHLCRIGVKITRAGHASFSGRQYPIAGHCVNGETTSEQTWTSSLFF